MKTWTERISQYSAEILPTSIRSFGVANSYLTFNCIVILLVQCTPLALDAISWRYFLIFLIMDVVFIVAFYFYCPETRKKTLEEIEALFGDDIAETLEEAGKQVEAEAAVGTHVEVLAGLDQREQEEKGSPPRV